MTVHIAAPMSSTEIFIFGSQFENINGEHTGKMTGFLFNILTETFD